MQHRVERLLNILLLLQRRATVRAADLAVQFGVSKRTIYRDLEALGAMGVPISAMPGEGYGLAEGFYMPPLSLTDEELEALLLGAKMLREHASGALSDAAQLAVEKIKHILPHATVSHVETLAGIIAFHASKRQIDLAFSNRTA
jgi:predicted DNA-binding transcriptional regulator YafY